MNYITEENYKTILDGSIIDDRIHLFIKKQCVNNLKDIKSIKKYVSKETGIKRNIPLLISSELFLIPVSSNISSELLFFNYFEIKDYIYKDGFLLLFFKDSTFTSINTSKYIAHQTFKRAKIVYQLFKDRHFIS